MADAAFHHVVIIGAGFGGLAACHGLAGGARDARVRITIVDQRNHHLFQPLLYQVGTAVLATSEIAWPIRHLVRNRPEVTTLLGVVTGVDAAASKVLLEDGAVLSYDTLIIATGARHAYFGHDEWEPFAPGLKTLEDATAIRRRILLSLERAEREMDPERRAALLTFVVVGGGPTGVELAGAIAELTHQNLAGDFRMIDTRTARVPAHRSRSADSAELYARPVCLRAAGAQTFGCRSENWLCGERLLQARSDLRRRKKSPPK